MVLRRVRSGLLSAALLLVGGWLLTYAQGPYTCPDGPPGGCPNPGVSVAGSDNIQMGDVGAANDSPVDVGPGNDTVTTTAQQTTNPVVVNLGDGDDLFSDAFGATVGLTVNGGAGNDAINASASTQNGVFNGEEGADTFTVLGPLPTPNNLLFDGGEGDDTFISFRRFNTTGTNTMLGGLGNDTFEIVGNDGNGSRYDGGPGNDTFTISCPRGTNIGVMPVRRFEVRGGPGNDTYTFTQAPTTPGGCAGAPVHPAWAQSIIDVYTGSGFDIVINRMTNVDTPPLVVATVLNVYGGSGGAVNYVGGVGPDNFFGSPGADRFTPGLGLDSALMGPGNDILVIQAGSNNAGNEVFDCGQGFDQVIFQGFMGTPVQIPQPFPQTAVVVDPFTFNQYIFLNCERAIVK